MIETIGWIVVSVFAGWFMAVFTFMIVDAAFDYDLSTAVLEWIRKKRRERE